MDTKNVYMGFNSKNIHTKLLSLVYLHKFQHGCLFVDQLVVPTNCYKKISKGVYFS